MKEKTNEENYCNNIDYSNDNTIFVELFGRNNYD